ncbi:unnamed protein product, partial [Discosporangium mesarthrocarpum]
SNDPYELGLTAAALGLYGRVEAARAIGRRLAMAQGKGGSVEGAATSITNSRGKSLVVETTAVSVLAWMHSGGNFQKEAEMGVRWLTSTCEGGMFGSTQAWREDKE